ncbi:MAG: matrixin family metalloprotease [Thermoanaerobaculia bacterium]
MTRKLMLCVPVALALLAPASLRAQEGEGDSYLLAAIHDFNGVLRAEWMDLRAEWMDLRVQQVDVLTIGQGRASARLHRQPFRWVAGDVRRRADGNKLTYLIDTLDLGASGLAAASAEAAIDRAMGTWSSDQCLQRVAVVKRPAGEDADIFDWRYGYGARGDYRAADIVHAGWLPPSFFESVTGPGGGENVVALSVTFIYIGLDGQPTDLDRDGHLDTAHNEIYYNEAFSWATGGMDVESVALHEVGHSLGIGHIGPPPEAVMNPIYAGTATSLFPLDHAALCSVWASWPN